MSTFTTISDTIFNFITKSPLDYITATTIIYKAMEIDSTIPNDQLSRILHNTISTVTNNRNINSNLYTKLRNISNKVNN